MSRCMHTTTSADVLSRLIVAPKMRGTNRMIVVEIADCRGTGEWTRGIEFSVLHNFDACLSYV